MFGAEFQFVKSNFLTIKSSILQTSLPVVLIIVYFQLLKHYKLLMYLPSAVTQRTRDLAWSCSPPFDGYQRRRGWRGWWSPWSWSWCIRRSSPSACRLLRQIEPKISHTTAATAAPAAAENTRTSSKAKPGARQAKTTFRNPDHGSIIAYYHDQTTRVTSTRANVTALNITTILFPTLNPPINSCPQNHGCTSTPSLESRYRLPGSTNYYFVIDYVPCTSC